MTRKCDVCYGTPGKYPIHNRFGAQLYEITCPECDGDGVIYGDKDLPSAEDVRGILASPELIQEKKDAK